MQVTQEKQLSNLWLLLNKLNLQTNSYPHEILSPFVSNKRKLLTVMTKIFADAYLLGIKNTEVDFLESTLKKIAPLKKNYNLEDEYWFEDASPQEFEDRAFIKALILEAHKNAKVE